MHVDWWTLALQTINVLILVWILGRFFFRPVTAIVAKRQEEAKKLLADAETMRLRADAAQAEADKARTEFEARRLELLGEVQAQAQAEKARLAEEAAQEAAKLRAAAATAIAGERAEAEQAMLHHAGELSLDIARRLLGRLPAESALTAFADGLCREVRALPPELRAGLEPGTSGGPLELWSACDLTDTEKQIVRDRLAEALGAAPPLAFHRDDALLAGLELRGPTTIVRNSWRSDLDRIGAELARDDHPGKA